MNTLPVVHRAALLWATACGAAAQPAIPAAAGPYIGPDLEAFGRSFTKWGETRLSLQLNE